nr:reverse transcriptase domain-containing protein [Tanacetum cinerariifolium]
MVNVIPLDHVDDVLVVEPNQHDDVPVVLEPVLVDEDEDPKEDEFKEKEDPQKEEGDMEVDIEEDENEPELTYRYEEVDPLNPLPPASESEPEDTIKVENMIEHEDETVLASVHKVVNRLLLLFFVRQRLCGREMANALVEKKRKAKDKYYGKLILDLGNEVRFSVEQGTDAMEKLVEKLGNAEDMVECKKLKNELEEEVFRNTFLQDLCLKKDQKKLSTFRLKMRRVHHLSCEDLLMMLSSLDSLVMPLLNDARGFGPARGQDAAPIAHECTFAGFMKCSPTGFHGAEGAVELLRWFKKTKSVFRISNYAGGKKVRRNLKNEARIMELEVKEYNIVAYTRRFNDLEVMCPRMVEPERMKVDAYIRGLTDNIKGEVTSSRPANMNEAVCMAYKLMDTNRKLEMKEFWKERSESGRAFKVEIVVVREIKGITHVKLCRITKGKETHELSLPLLLMGSFLCVNDVLLAMLASVRSSTTSVERNRCPRKVKQEEVGEFMVELMLLRMLRQRVRMWLPVKIGASYEVELADGRVVSTNTVLKGCTLNLVNHIFKIDLMPIELGTFDFIIGMDWLVKHDFVIVCGKKVVRILYGNKMLIVKSDKGMSRLNVISCIKACKYVERGCHLFLAYLTENKSKEKRMEDVHVIRMHILHVHHIDWHSLRRESCRYNCKSCWRKDLFVRVHHHGCKYVERGCHLFLAYLTENKSKEKRMEDVHVIRNFPNVFPEELPGLPPSRKVEFQIDLVPGMHILHVHHIDWHRLRRESCRYNCKSCWRKDLFDEEEHEKPLKIILELLKKERLYAKFSKCDFWLDSVQFLVHVINHSGVHVDLAKIKAIKSWVASTTPMEVRQFLGLAGKKKKSISSTKASSKFEAEITSSSYGFVWTNENCQYKWKAVYFGDCRRLLSLHVAVIITFLKRITVLLQSPVIIIRTDNGTKFKNQVLKVYFDSVGISHQMSSVRTPQQNGVVERRNRTIYNRRTKKIMETMNVSFDELSAMAFKQRSSKPRLQSMTYGQISLELDLTYAPLTITKQQPTE